MAPSPLSSRIESLAGSGTTSSRGVPFCSAARNSRLKRACKLQQHRLDVLAGAQAVDAEIHAIAGELPLAHVADFHRVGQAAAGPDAEVGEDRVARVGVRDAELLRLRPRAAAVDFVFVRRAPIVRRRHGNIRRCLLWHSGHDARDRAGGVKAELFTVVHRLFTASHALASHRGGQTGVRDVLCYGGAGENESAHGARGWSRQRRFSRDTSCRGAAELSSCTRLGN